MSLTSVEKKKTVIDQLKILRKLKFDMLLLKLLAFDHQIQLSRIMNQQRKLAIRLKFAKLNTYYLESINISFYILQIEGLYFTIPRSL